MNITKYQRSSFKGKIMGDVKAVEALRQHPDNPTDVSFAEFVQTKYNMDYATFLGEIGVDPSIDTISNLIIQPDLDVRWIIPEVFRAALTLGYRKAPIWPNIVAAEEQMKSLAQVMPWFNMSDAAPMRVGEGETIPLGQISYGSKTFKIFKVGRGIKITDEVVNYSTINVVSIFLKDFGVKMGHAVDVLAINCLINGEQTDSSESAYEIGVTASGNKTYSDFLRVWTRMARIGRGPSTILGGEAAAMKTLNLAEFKTPIVGNPLFKLNLNNIPLPQASEYYVHGNIPASKEIVLDKSAGLIKFNGWPLKVESERIVSNQTEAFYVTLQTGFAKLFRDAAVIMNEGSTTTTWPTWMDVDALQNVVIS
jgi:hypothetical protein